MSQPQAKIHDDGYMVTVGGVTKELLILIIFKGDQKRIFVHANILSQIHTGLSKNTQANEKFSTVVARTTELATAPLTLVEAINKDGDLEHMTYRHAWNGTRALFCTLPGARIFVEACNAGDARENRAELLRALDALEAQAAAPKKRRHSDAGPNLEHEQATALQQQNCVGVLNALNARIQSLKASGGSQADIDELNALANAEVIRMAKANREPGPGPAPAPQAPPPPQKPKPGQHWRKALPTTAPIPGVEVKQLKLKAANGRSGDEPEFTLHVGKGNASESLLLCALSALANTCLEGVEYDEDKMESTPLYGNPCTIYKLIQGCDKSWGGHVYKPTLDGLVRDMDRLFGRDAVMQRVLPDTGTLATHRFTQAGLAKLLEAKGLYTPQALIPSHLQLFHFMKTVSLVEGALVDADYTPLELPPPPAKKAKRNTKGFF